jgi:glyoxylase-like metal-dependent hydrolase (beta-lactamase superfamily II)
MVKIIDNKEISIEKLVLGPYETNCYIVVDRGTNLSLVIDAPAAASKISGALGGSPPLYILLTHDHSDHTGALDTLRSRFKSPLAAHNASALHTPPDIVLKGGETLDFGNLGVGVFHTPGHAPGSLCFKIGNYLFAGDTIFPGGPGKTWSPRDFQQIVSSIKSKIFNLPDDTIIFPGHGETTTIMKSKEEYEVFASHHHPDDICGDVSWLTS